MHPRNTQHSCRFAFYSEVISTFWNTAQPLRSEQYFLTLLREAPPSSHSSRSSIMGSTDNARWAGIHVATNPNNAMASTTPVSTSGSRGVAW